MSKETIPQSIIDKINEKYPDWKQFSSSYLREAAIWGYGLSEGRIKELEEWIDNEIATSKNKLNDLSPLDRHALQAPIKAQIALLEDLKLKFIPKTLKDYND